MDTFTGDVPALDRCAAVLAGWAAQAGLDVELVPSPDGVHVIASTTGGGTGRTLLIGHHDTVFVPGTGAARPVRIEGTRALGPGVADQEDGHWCVRQSSYQCTSDLQRSHQ